MDEKLTRGIAGAGLVVVLGLGAYTGSRLGLELSDEVEVALARRVSPKQAQAKALEKQGGYKDSEAFYQTLVDEAVAQHGLPKPELAALREPNTFYHSISPGAPKRLAPAATLREGDLEISVKVETVEVERRGARTKTLQTLALLHNVGNKPLAYHLQVRGSAGDCGVRALTRYDAIVLLPDEPAEIAVCTGEHELEIVDLRVLELSELGAAWASKIPPQALGLDDATVRSHNPGEGVQMCAELPVVEFARLLESGTSQWEDIVDFYSRHDCEHYRWWPGYKRIVEPLAKLPALAEDASG